MAKDKYYKRPDGLYEVSRTINGKRVRFRGKTCREVDQKNSKSIKNTLIYSKSGWGLTI